MKIKKRISIVADILVDEDFDTNACLCICELIDTVQADTEIYVGRSNNFEVLDYISQEAIELDEDGDVICPKCSGCGRTSCNEAAERDTCEKCKGTGKIKL